MSRVSDHSHLVQKPILLQSDGAHHQSLGNIAYLMTDPKYSGTGADWTQLLTDPALVSHLGDLLQIYREAPADKRDQVLLEAMRNIKGGVSPLAAAPKAAAAAAKTQPAEAVSGCTRLPRLPPARRQVRRFNLTSLRRTGAKTAAVMLACDVSSRSSCVWGTQLFRCGEICPTPAWADASSKPLRPYPRG